MYVKFQNAAVFVDDKLAQQTAINTNTRASQDIHPTCTTLWATKPLMVPKGRVVGVRKIGQSIQVGIVATGNTSVGWLPSASLLTQAQINRWMNSSSFRAR